MQPELTWEGVEKVGLALTSIESYFHLLEGINENVEMAAIGLILVNHATEQLNILAKLLGVGIYEERGNEVGCRSFAQHERSL